MEGNPLQNDAIHQLLKGLIDEATSIRDYRVRALLVNDLETSELYQKIAYEEVEHLGEFLKRIIQLDPKFKEYLLRGMLEHSKESSVEENIEGEDE